MDYRTSGANFGAPAALLFIGLFVSAGWHARAQQPQQERSGAAVSSPRTSPVPGATSADSAAANLPAGVRATERAVDASIPDDSSVNGMLEPYSVKVRGLEIVIGKLANDLTKEGIGSGSLGNFVADAMMARSREKLRRPIALALTNRGGLRKNVVTAGELRVRDIYEILPFENALVTVELNGEQLVRLLNGVVRRRDAQSGARIKYGTNAEGSNELKIATLIGTAAAELVIDPNASYTVVTSDYLVSGSNDHPVLKESKKVEPLGVTLRDAVLEYVKAESAAGREIKSALDGRFDFEGAGPTKKEGERLR